MIPELLDAGLQLAAFVDKATTAILFTAALGAALTFAGVAGMVRARRGASC